MKRVGIVGLLLFAGVLLAGKAEVNAQVPPCTPVTIEAPLVLNSVTVDTLVKTVKLEKEVFLCGATAAGQPSLIRDTQLFLEVIEQLRPVFPAGRHRDGEKRLEVVTKRFEVITCDKVIDSASLKECHSDIPPSLLQPPFFIQCAIAPQQPSHPVAMNTVAVGDFVKTIKAQKELFRCEAARIVTDGVITIAPAIADLNTLTEIIEKKMELGAIGGETFEVVEKRIEQAICVKTFDGVVRGCGVFPVLDITPSTVR